MTKLFFKGLAPGGLEWTYHSYSMVGLAPFFGGATVNLTKTFVNLPVIALARYELNRVMNPLQDK